MSKIWSCFFYENIAKNCIHQFKYRQKPNMTAIFQLNIQHLLLTITPLLKNIDIIIPVPLHKTRKHFRGFNQTELIAKILSKNLSIPIKPNILIKTKKTMPQVNLPRQERIINLKNCFCVQNSRIIHGKNILIVDDVTTTGTTLNICAKELITRGAKEIFGFTLAKTR
ncbi:MAG: phosphoribosyltransferase family protein [Candidatus Omnitrophota bacterium]